MRITMGYGSGKGKGKWESESESERSVSGTPAVFDHWHVLRAVLSHRCISGVYLSIALCDCACDSKQIESLDQRFDASRSSAA